MGDRVREIALLAAALVCAVVGYGTPRFLTADWSLSPRAEGVLTVVTWNLGTAVDDRGESSGLDDQYLQAVIEALVSLEPDLVFLQELSNAGQVDAIARALGGDRRPFVQAVQTRGQRPIAILARGGELQGQSISRRRGRRPLLVRWTGGASPGPLILANVHASPWSARDRNLEIGAVAEALLESGEAALLAGDLNLAVDLRGRRDLFTDDEHRDLETYAWLADRLEDLGRDAGPTAEPDRRLDYLWLAGDALRSTEVGVWKGQRLGGMDHDPLVCRLVVRR